MAQDFIREFLQPYLCFAIHVPIKMTVCFNRTKSIWLPKRERKPFRKADLDNYIKLCLDGINGILIPDDAQVTTLIASKVWTNKEYGYIQLRLEEDNG